MKTLLHKNLHNGLVAITQRGLVVGYCTSATLVNVDVKEDAKKASHTRAGNKRTVHLWIRGDLVSVTGFTPLKGRTVAISEFGITDFPASAPVSYNPHRDSSLVWSDGSVFTTAAVAIFDSTRGMFAV